LAGCFALESDPESKRRSKPDGWLTVKNDGRQVIQLKKFAVVKKQY